MFHPNFRPRLLSMNSLQRVACIFAVILVPALAHAATYYVTKSGRDSNSCAQAQSMGTAKLTIAAGIGCMSGGDTLIIGDGTYNEQILNLVPAGSAAAPTTLQAQNRNQAILLPTSTAVGWAVLNINASYVTIDGLVLDARNCSDNGGAYITDRSSSTTTNVTIKNGTIRNAIGAYSTPSAVPNGIAMNGGVTNHTFQNLDIYNVKGHGIYNKGSGNLIDGNRIYSWSSQSDISAYGIHVYCWNCTANNNIVRNNTIHDWQTGVILSSGSSNMAYNNLIYHNSLNGIVVRYSCSGCTLYSNTVYSNTQTCAFLDSSTTNAKVQNNICRMNGADIIQNDSSAATIDHNLIGVDPRFVDASAPNFHLSADSPARNAGIAVSAVSTDFDGKTRPQGLWDIGAFMYLAGTTVSAPANLRVIGQ